MDYELMKHIYLRQWHLGFMIPCIYSDKIYEGEFLYFNGGHQAEGALHHWNFPPFQREGLFISYGLDFNKF